jgi:hypothetical protein
VFIIYTATIIGHLKVYGAVDIKPKKLLSIEVIEEKMTDSEILRSLLKNISLMDGGYDTNDTFAFIKEK